MKGEDQHKFKSASSLKIRVGCCCFASEWNIGRYSTFSELVSHSVVCDTIEIRHS